MDIRDAFFEEVYKIASEDKDVFFITADADAFSLRKYKNDFSKRFINVGVAEQGMVTVATGLALSGKKVFIYSMIPFIALRCYELIKVDICSMNLPVIIVGLGSGFSFNYDGPTHHAVCDIAVMRALPKMQIFNPSDAFLASQIAWAAYNVSGPVYVRLDKGIMPKIHKEGLDLSEGFAQIADGNDLCIVSTGIMSSHALDVAIKLKEYGISATVLDLYRLKPVNARVLSKVLSRFSQVVTLEEHSLIGGLGSILSEIITDGSLSTRLKRIALKDEQCFYYGAREWIHAKYNIDKTGILRQILNWYR